MTDQTSTDADRPVYRGFTWPLMGRSHLLLWYAYAMFWVLFPFGLGELIDLLPISGKAKFWIYYPGLMLILATGAAFLTRNCKSYGGPRS